MEELILQAENLRDVNPEGAIVIYEQVYSANPSEQFWAGFWQALLVKWHVSNRESIPLFESLLEQFPDSDLIRVELAQNLIEVQRYRDSVVYLNQVQDPELLPRVEDILSDLNGTRNNITLFSNTFRPDNENFYGGQAQTSWRVVDADTDFTVSLSEKIWPEQNNADITSLSLDIQRNRTLLRVGASLLDQAVFPNLAIEHLVIENENDTTLKLRYQYRVNDSDPEAIVEEITQHVLGYQLWKNDLYLSTDFQINSDDILVTESFAEIKLTKDNFLALTAYLRTSNGNSDFYWTPETFSNISLRFAFPVFNDCFLGLSPGIVYERDNNESDVDFAVPLGAACYFDNTSVSARFDYGLSLEVKHNF